MPNFFWNLTIGVCTLLPFTSFGQIDSNSASVELDHIVFFVSDSSLEELLDQHFTQATLLSTQHTTQGTSGKYYLFYNTFIELLYLNDKIVAQENEGRFKSEYSKRWHNTEACPFGFGINTIPFNNSSFKPPFEKYRGLNSAEDDYYLMAPSNRDLKQPLIYISLPEKKYKQFNSIEDVDKEEEYKREALRSYLSHKSKTKRLSKIVLTTNSDTVNESYRLLQETKTIQIDEFKEEQLILSFDNEEQGKEIVYKGEFNLIIRY